MKNSSSGFTIVELLIVIIIIAILAAISIVAYTGVQTRAAAAATVADLRSTEKAFRLHFMFAGHNRWPREGQQGLPQSPSIQYFIDNVDGFSDFMSSPPKSDDGEWQYDSDNGVEKDIPCGDEDEINQGVNIAIKTTNPNVREAIDKFIDDGDGNLCGKFRWFESGHKAGDSYYNLDPVTGGTL